MKKKVSVTIENYEDADIFAKTMGHKRVANMIGVALVEYMNFHADVSTSNGKGEVLLKLDNIEELKEYVKEKRLTSIAAFADFAMGRYMSQYPPKKRSGVPRRASESKNQKASEARDA